MKILALADIHDSDEFNINLKEQGIDLVVSCGDVPLSII